MPAAEGVARLAHERRAALEAGADSGGAKAASNKKKKVGYKA